MLKAITDFANGITPTQVDKSLVISKALTMYDGTVASGQNRYTTSQIALYEFKTDTGTIAYDTSGVEPELDMNLTGNYTWDAGWGVVFAPGSKAQGTTTRQLEAVQHDHRLRRGSASRPGYPRPMWRRPVPTSSAIRWPEGAQCDAVAESLPVPVQCQKQRHGHQRCAGPGYRSQTTCWRRPPCSMWS